MLVTIAHPISLVPKVAGRGPGFARNGMSPAGGFWTRLMSSFANKSLPADREYERLLESSGGKFTDGLEREAERRTLHGPQSERELDTTGLAERSCLASNLVCFGADAIGAIRQDARA